VARRRNRITGLSRLLEQIPAESVEQILASFQRAGEAEISRVWGKPSITLHVAGTSGSRAGPYPLVVRIDRAKVTKRTTTITLYGSPAGFWAWAEDGASRHTIRARKRATKTGRPPALFGELQHPMGEVTHPGFAGRGAWTRTVEAAERELDGILLAALDEIAEAA
jgi:hypothetical protein